MATTFGRFSFALGRVATAAFQEWARAWSDPVQGNALNGFALRRNRYEMLWHYYENSIFDALLVWAQYKSLHGLYHQIRSIYNPTRRLCDFYAGAVYPGVLSEDGAHLPDGVPLAIPLAKDMPLELKSAVAQFWQWSNWQSGKNLMVRFGAVSGSVLVEVNDDLERGVVSATIWWPGFVRDLELDSSGNVLSYALEYVVLDPSKANGSYLYRKEADKDGFRTYMDDHPWSFEGQPHENENPYGFCPAVWVKHKDLGQDFGAPAIHGVIGLVDEVNSLVSHAHDGVHKQINQPFVAWSSGKLTKLGERAKQPSSATDYSGDITNIAAQREKVLFLEGPPDGRIDSLVGTIAPDKAIPFLEKLLAEIEDQKPELTLYKQLRSMQQVTGPGAQRMIGDAAAPFYEAQANYDLQSIKLFQMAVAIAGWRAASGDWGTSLNRQQLKFAPFGLDSYEAGQLDFAIAPRPLVPITGQEHWDEVASQGQAINAMVTAGIPLETTLVRDFGWTEEEVAEIEAKKLDQIQQARDMFGAGPGGGAIVTEVATRKPQLPAPAAPRRMKGDAPQSVVQ